MTGLFKQGTKEHKLKAQYLKHNAKINGSFLQSYPRFALRTKEGKGFATGRQQRLGCMPRTLNSEKG